ncbi:MAG: hypothetical protein OXG07_01270 [Anaerolineaceae bacterium]|nr:hypothetical protein [Anaerolineaceae bacterium]MCY3906257.1 hypothetical protein [Anaerolineaceae bacterium]
MLQLEDSGFEGHIASPHVHVDHERRRIHLYYHGMMNAADRASVVPEIDERFFYTRRSRVALSRDGLNFDVQPQLVAPAYLRVVTIHGMVYGISMPGLLCRSEDGLGVFESGPLPFGDDARREDFFFPPGRPPSVTWRCTWKATRFTSSARARATRPSTSCWPGSTSASRTGVAGGRGPAHTAAAGATLGGRGPAAGAVAARRGARAGLPAARSLSLPRR